jgi:glycosyltransferase involved in cell wall biosynthesis
VINQHAKKTLKKKFNIDAVVVPNVMDFDKPFAEKNRGNSGLLTDLGLEKEAIPLFQVTRIVERKGIEVAIDLVHQLEDTRIHLVITGSHKDDEGGRYYNNLINQIHDLHLTNQVLFTDGIIQNHSWKGRLGSIKYSLADAYAYARACTYFSTYEGFGNAFVEAVLAKKPIFVNNYKPVYMPDIGRKGFKTVMLEDNNLDEKAVSEMREVIYNEKLNAEIGEYNYQIGKQHFSYDVLQELLEELLNGS